GIVAIDIDVLGHASAVVAADAAAEVLGLSAQTTELGARLQQPLGVLVGHVGAGEVQTVVAVATQAHAGAHADFVVLGVVAVVVGAQVHHVGAVQVGCPVGTQAVAVGLVVVVVIAVGFVGGDLGQQA